MNIAVVAGGISHERDVSLTSGSLIARALVEKGHRVRYLDIYKDFTMNYDSDEELFTDELVEVYHVPSDPPDLDSVRRSSGSRGTLIGKGVLDVCTRADVVFIALHGDMGENGQLQATFDNFGIKYTGSGYIGSLLAMDKDLSKRLLKTAGILTPDWMYVDTSEYNIDEIIEKIGVPCVVKPCSCGSSVGVSIVDSEEDLASALWMASGYESHIIVEKKITGRELTSACLCGDVLPPVEIIPKNGFYDYKNKYQSGMTQEICPAKLPYAVTKDLEYATKTAFDALRLRGYARADFILDEDNKLWCLEVNTLPGMTPTSLLPQSAAAVGIDYNSLCVIIAESGLK